jgi:uncharacterized membrane protein
MGIDSFGYKVMLLLHILTAIIGFGGVLLNGLYAREARNRPPAAGLAILEANTFVSLKVAEKFIWAVPILGFGLAGMSDDVWKMRQTWLAASIVLYLLSLAVSYGFLQPRVKQVVALQREVVAAEAAGTLPTDGPPPQVAKMAALGKQIGASSGVLHLSLVVILILMIWKPGV